DDIGVSPRREASVMNPQGEVAVFVHAATVYRIESANLLDGTAVVVQHHAALSGVRHMLIVTVKHRNIVQLVLTSQIEELISEVRLRGFDVRKMPVVGSRPGIVIP